jgi:hemerythrin superfamily protein
MPAIAKKHSPKQPKRRPAARSSSRRSADAPDAISLLKSDHREVDALFAKFEKATAADRKASIVAKICDALSVHAAIEEEIMYPAARAALKRKDDALLDEAKVEHQTIKDLVAYLRRAKPTAELYDAKVNVLGEYVKHHVKEEEREMFPKLRMSDFDSDAIGAKLAHRKEQLTGKPVKREPSFLERGLEALGAAGARPDRPVRGARTGRAEQTGEEYR